MFSQTAEYALRAVVWLAQNETKPQTTQEIAQATKVPAGYLSKVLQILVRTGLLRAARGKNGGFELRQPASTLAVLDVINAVDPIRRIHTCPLGLTSHRLALCPLHQKLDDALATVERGLGGVTFAELLGPSQSRPLCEIPPVGAEARA